MSYIGDYQADRWFILAKIYKENILIEYETFMLDTDNYEDMCKQISELKDTYIEDNMKILHPRKSVYILEYKDKKFIIKAIKI